VVAQAGVQSVAQAAAAADGGPAPAAWGAIQGEAAPPVQAAAQSDGWLVLGLRALQMGAFYSPLTLALKNLYRARESNSESTNVHTISHISGIASFSAIVPCLNS